MASGDIRVLHVLDVLTPDSGVAQVVMNMVAGIPQIRQDIAIYGRCDANLEREVVSRGGAVHKLPDVTEVFGARFGRAFSNLLQTRTYTTIHGHLRNSAFIYLREATRKGIPHRIIHAHSTASADTKLKRLRNNVLSLGIPRWANEYIAVSDAAGKAAFGSSRPFTVIHNGIDTERFRYNPDVRKQTRQELGLTDDEICVGHVGRLVELKNHGFTLAVFNEIRKQARCKLLLVGDGHLGSSLQAQAEHLGLSDSVRFMGARNDVDRLYQAFDVFLLPSLSEGFPLSIVEAQCAGLGCIVSDNVSADVICSNRIWHLPLGNVEEWLDAVLDMERLPRVGGSDDVIAAGLDIETICRKIQKIYETPIGDIL